MKAEPLAVEIEPPANKAPKRKKQRGKKGKAFDAVLGKEDVEGPVVVTSAGSDGELRGTL